MTISKRSDWTNQLLLVLEQMDDAGREAANYLRDHSTHIGFRRVRKNIGAFWTPMKSIRLNTVHFTLESNPADPRVLTLIIHEVKHLQQGIVTALSVYGELEAWQLQFRLYHKMTEAIMHTAIEELLSLPWGWDRDVLRRARQLMQEYAGKGYRADLLPLYPFWQELRYRFTGQRP